MLLDDPVRRHVDAAGQRRRLAGDPHLDRQPGEGEPVDQRVQPVSAADPSLSPPVVEPGPPGPVVAVIGFTTVFTVLLSVVAVPGVFDTLLLTVRERRRDLGMLEPIGVTPRQVVAMTVTSVARQGVVSGVVGIPSGCWPTG
ncbi:FtsX-like permease family protein [Kitasatospora sp. NPDC092039]|uniref:FtsX-like permease family protein n=1 Tax=Kitasatospora sp. NPDC092039 TaxID=3364086 RepID=UPI0037F6454A